jgi:hypothetical protein
MRTHLLKVTAVITIVTGACGGKNSAAREEEARAAERKGMEVAVAAATQAASLPATGLWSEAHLMDRLVRAGVAPRAREGAVPATPWMPVPPIALLAGGGELFVWIFADSSARRAATDAIDPVFGAPRGTVSPFPPPVVFVTQNNLAAVIVGGRESNQERIALALQAGLPVSP